MRFFKYLTFLFLLTLSTFLHADYITWSGGSFENPSVSARGSTASISCSNFGSKFGFTGKVSSGNCYDQNNNLRGYIGFIEPDCPSATSVDLKVPTNAQSYQCVSGCQYRLRACVDVDFEGGMTCSAISTGIACGGTPPPKPVDPNAPATPDSPTDTPAAPGQNSSNTNTNTATTTGTSTSTSTSTSTKTTENNTTTTNTTTNTTINNNTTTTLDLSSLESTIRSLGDILGAKLDAIKEALGGDSGGDTGTPDGNGTDLTDTNAKIDENNSLLSDLKDWLTGEGDGSNGSGGDNPFGNDAVPEKALTPQDLKTNIFSGSAACPADRTLSFQLFTGKTFSKSFSFAMWCDKLAIFGTLILIASYLYGAYIITSKS